MAVSNVSSFVVLVFSMALCITLGYPADEPAGGKSAGFMMMKTCAGAEFKPPVIDDATMAKVQACKGNMTGPPPTGAAPTGPPKDDGKCHEICIGQAMGLIDASGKIVKDALNARVEALVPAAKLADFKKIGETCLAENESKLDLTKCSTYKDLMKCAHKAAATVCEWKDTKEGPA